MINGFDGRTFTGRWANADKNKPKKSMKIIATVKRDDDYLFIQSCEWNGERWEGIPEECKVLEWCVIKPYKEK